MPFVSAVPVDIPDPPPVLTSLDRVPAPGPHVRAPRAIFEILLCSGLPSQLVLGELFALFGFAAKAPDGTLRALPLFALVVLDTVVILTLVIGLLHASGERLRDLVVGPRRPLFESALGLALVPLLFIGVGLTVLTMRRVMPWMHNVPDNPFGDVMRTPSNAGLFAMVVIVAGGIREEVQRAFLLHRFDRSLGLAVPGLVLVSVAFGLGHAIQGWDAAIATGLLGLTWGILFFARRSAIASIVSHSGYDIAQVLQAVAVQGLRL